MPAKSQSKLLYLGQYILTLFRPWRQIDWLLLFLVIGVTIFGSLAIHSTELAEGLDRGYQHWAIGAVGLGIALLISRWRYESLLQWHWLIYLLTNISLIAVMTTGVTAKGAQRWITVAGFNLQPSEFAKIAVIITLAALLHQENTSKLGAVLRTLAITTIPWGLVFYSQIWGRL